MLVFPSRHLRSYYTSFNPILNVVGVCQKAKPFGDRGFHLSYWRMNLNLTESSIRKVSRTYNALLFEQNYKTSHLYLQVKGFTLLEALDSHSKKNGYIKSGHFLLRVAQAQPLFKHRGYRYTT